MLKVTNAKHLLARDLCIGKASLPQHTFSVSVGMSLHLVHVHHGRFDDIDGVGGWSLGIVESSSRLNIKLGYLLQYTPVSFGIDLETGSEHETEKNINHI